MSEISHAVAIFEAGIAVSLSVLTTIARMLQQRAGAGSALWPIGTAAPDARQWLVAAAGGARCASPGLHMNCAVPSSPAN